MKREEREQRNALCAIRAYAQQHMPRLAYHTFSHAVNFVDVARELGKLEGVSSSDSFLLQTAGYLHDLVYVPGASDNEEASAMRAQEILPAHGYDFNQTTAVCRLILATKLPTKPRHLLEEIMCDSDLANLGTPQALENSELVRLELGIPAGSAWDEQLYQFFDKHRYYTLSAQLVYGPGLAENRDRLLGRVLENARKRA